MARRTRRVARGTVAAMLAILSTAHTGGPAGQASELEVYGP